MPSVVPGIAERCGIDGLTTGDEELGHKTFHASGTSYEFGTVGLLQSSSKKVVMDALAHLEEGTLAMHSKRWCGRMSVIRHDDCNALGEIEQTRRLCHEAGMCLCNDDGRRMVHQSPSLK